MGWPSLDIIFILLERESVCAEKVFYLDQPLYAPRFVCFCDDLEKGVREPTGFPHTSPDGDTIMIQVCLVFGGNNSAQIFDCVGSALERLIQADIAKMAPCTVASVQRYVTTSWASPPVPLHVQSNNAFMTGYVRHSAHPVSTQASHTRPQTAIPS